MKLKRLHEVARALGRDLGQLLRESKRPGFPLVMKAGEPWADVDKVRTWIAGNIKPRRKRSHRISAEPSALPGTPPPAPPAGAPITPPASAAPAGLDALEISRRAVDLVWRIIESNAAKGLVNPVDIDALKKSLGELRQGESDYLALQERRGLLIEKEKVLHLVGTLASRLVRCCGILENAIGGELAVWLADPEIAAMPADERDRKVREFVRKTCDAVRQAEADGAEKLIDQLKDDDE